MYRPPPSVSNYARFTHAKQQSSASKAKNQTRQTKKQTKEKPPKTEEAKEGVGCESGT